MERFDALDDKLCDFIRHQHVFFVGTGGSRGAINVSPKGLDTLRIVNPGRIVWLNLTGSGNETSAHVQENGRMTLMFCSFDRQPLILRLYGTATIVHPRDSAWPTLVSHFDTFTGARQIFDFTIDLVQTSCGYAVPHYAYEGERETLTKWSEKKGKGGIESYWAEMNTVSLDGQPIDI